MSLRSTICMPVNEASTEIQKIEYAICRTNSAALVLRDLAIELERHDAVSAAMVRQQLFVANEVVDRLYIKKKMAHIASMTSLRESAIQAAIKKADYIRVTTAFNKEDAIIKAAFYRTDDGHDGTEH